MGRLGRRAAIAMTLVLVGATLIMLIPTPVDAEIVTVYGPSGTGNPVNVEFIIAFSAKPLLPLPTEWLVCSPEIVLPDVVLIQNRLRFQMTVNLAPGTAYQCWIQGVRTTAGVPFEDQPVFAFTTLFDTSPPVANAGLSRTVHPFLPTYLDGTGSHDNQDIIDYRWEYQNGSADVILHGVVRGVTFYEEGTYAITLTVTDEAGNLGRDIIYITVKDEEPPVARAGSDLRTIPGVSLALLDRGSTDNVEVVNWTWYIHDRYGITERYGPQTSYTFEHLSTDPYLVTLEVRDRSYNTARDNLHVLVMEQVVLIDPGNLTINTILDHGVAIDSEDFFGPGVSVIEYRVQGNGTDYVIKGDDPVLDFAIPGDYRLTFTLERNGTVYTEEGRAFVRNGTVEIDTTHPLTGYVPTLVIGLVLGNLVLVVGVLVGRRMLTLRRERVEMAKAEGAPVPAAERIDPPDHLDERN